MATDIMRDDINKNWLTLHGHDHPAICRISTNGDAIMVEADHDFGTQLKIDVASGTIISNGWESHSQDDDMDAEHGSNTNPDAHDVHAITQEKVFRPMYQFELAMMARLIHRGVAIPGYWIE